MGPPTGVEDEAFWAEPSEPLAGAVWMPDAGYVNDPQLAARNLQHAAEAHGARFRFRAEVVGIERDDERVTGVTLADGGVVRAPVVVNVAGPDSARVNRLAGLGGTMAIGTRPMRQEVHHVPSPVGPDGRVLECMVGDDDTGIYFRPEAGGMIAVGSLEPTCDEQEWLDSTDGYQHSVTRPVGNARLSAWPGASPVCGSPTTRSGSSGSTTSLTTGSRSMTGRTSTGSTSRSAPRATSSRTRRSPRTPWPS